MANHTKWTDQNNLLSRIMLIALCAMAFERIANPKTPLAAAEPPLLPESVTSFGAAISGDDLYVYGGHTAEPHEYFQQAQANTLWRLNLKASQQWESLGNGPRLQGLAMIAHGNQLYRIGGFTARNHQGEEQDLWSQAAVACYDSRKHKWHPVTSLPEPRSSFDAALLDNQIVVVGGWQMQGQHKKKWHKTAYTLDLTKANARWQALPEPPFQRRALAVATHNGKVFSVGGMQPMGGPTTRVDIYDPISKCWTLGPPLPGKAMEGFGCSAFSTGEFLYVSTLSGQLQRLAKDAKSWQFVQQLKRERFFHRMLSTSDKQLLLIGGASMSQEKFRAIDVVDVTQNNQSSK